MRILLAAGAVHADNALFDLLSGNSAKLRERLEADPSVLAATFDIGYGRNQYLEFGGQYGGAPLANTTLLHHCAEFGFEDEAKLLIGCGADTNAKARDTGGHTRRDATWRTLRLAAPPDAEEAATAGDRTTFRAITINVAQHHSGRGIVGDRSKLRRQLIAGKWWIRY